MAQDPEHARDPRDWIEGRGDFNDRRSREQKLTYLEVELDMFQIRYKYWTKIFI